VSGDAAARARSVEERVALALPPALVRAGARIYVRLPPGSSLRRRIFKRAFRLGLAGSARGDHAFALLFYERDVDLRVLGAVARALGFAESYRGHSGYIEAWREYAKDMDDLHVAPEQIVDLGRRVALRAKLVGVGRSSGAVTAQTLGYICYISPRGLIERQEAYWEWEEALASLAGTAPPVAETA
jgi:hypothetical protein